MVKQTLRQVALLNLPLLHMAVSGSQAMTDLPIINLSGYRFVHLDDLQEIQTQMKQALSDIGMQGSIMLATEGINVSLAGTAQQVAATRNWFDEDSRFADLWLKESASSEVPYRRLPASRSRWNAASSVANALAPSPDLRIRTLRMPSP